jgi:hypothetical protein
VGEVVFIRPLFITRWPMPFFLMDDGKIAAADCEKTEGSHARILIECHLTQPVNSDLSAFSTRWHRPALEPRELFFIWILIYLIET